MRVVIFDSPPKGHPQGCIRAVATRNRDGIRVEVEVTNLIEVEEAIAAHVDRILFDNMRLEMLGNAVRSVQEAGDGIETEASGGVNLHTIRGIAETGVDFISVGAITHSAPALDLSLLVDDD